MNQSKMSFLEIDRQKERIFGNLKSAFYDLGLEDGKELVQEASAELDELQETVYGDKPATVKSVVQDLYEICNADEITYEGKPISVADISVADIQDIMVQQVCFLAELLGIELEE